MKKNLSILFVVWLIFSLLLTACGGGSEGGDTSGGGGDTGSGDDGGTLIENSTDFDWCGVYVSPVSQETWGANQIEGQTIAVGEGFNLYNFEPGTYDLMLESCDGATQGTMQIEVSQ